MSKKNNILDQIGLRKLQKSDLELGIDKFIKAVDIGIKRSGRGEEPTEEDGGFRAIPTGVDPITLEDWWRVAVERKAIGCSYGGTNWVTGIVEKDKHGIAKTTILDNTTIPAQDRKLSFLAFIDLMADIIARVSQRGSALGMESIGISAGFPLKNTLMKNGMIESQFTNGLPCKDWEISDYNYSLRPENQPFIGESLITALKMRNIQNISKVFILNDANSVEHFIDMRDINLSSRLIHLPVGFVFGTGTNAAIKGYNLESSSAKLLEADKILTEMAKRSLIDSNRLNRVEHWIGGDNIRKRVASAMALIGREDLFQKVMDFNDTKVISLIASGEMEIEGLSSLIDYSLTTDEYSLLKNISSRVLNQAGQLIGIVISATVKAAGYVKGAAHIPIEGTVYWQGQNVKEKALETMNILIPGNELRPVEASGLTGIAQLAMVRTQRG